MVENKNILVLREKDPALIEQGLWLAMQYGNKIAKQRDLPPTEEWVGGIHARIIRPIVLPEFKQQAEEYRTRDILILGAVANAAHWRDIPARMEEYGREIHERVDSLKKKRFPAVGDFLNLISFAHYEEYQIHPFYDGHKRTGRQVIDVLSKYLGFEPILIGPRHKRAYLDSMETATRTGDIGHFTIFITELFMKAYRERQSGDCRYCYQSAVAHRASLARRLRIDEKQKPPASLRQNYQISAEGL